MLRPALGALTGGDGFYSVSAAKGEGRRAKGEGYDLIELGVFGVLLGVL